MTVMIRKRDTEVFFKCFLIIFFIKNRIMPEGNYYNQTPTNNVIVCGLPKHITEADVSYSLSISFCNI